MKLILVVHAGPLAGARFEFDRHETFLVGRAPDTHLTLSEDAHFSRHHFVLEVNPPQCLLRDLNSRNGTFVNGRRVTQALLKHGDEISGGKTRMRVELEATPRELKDVAATPPAPAPQPASMRDDSHVLDFQPVPDYEVLSLLGQGKMGTVYLARHRETDERFALKVITPESSVRPKVISLFLREVSVLSQLHHPRIVRLHDTGASGGMLYFVMEYIETVDVHEVLAGRSEAFKTKTFCAIISQVLEGLAHAHARSFVHRDIKPGNILLSRVGKSLHVKVADFGLAKNYMNAGLSGMTVEGELLGTCAFMAPEQILNARDSKPTVDIYSAGASLYQFLANQYPHEYTRDQHPLATVLEEDAVPLTTRAPHIPAELAAIVHRSLARRPEDRFQTAEEMRDALAPFR